MSIKNAIIFALIFFTIGELVIRFDKATMLFGGTRTQIVENTFGYLLDTDGDSTVQAQSDTTGLRVMVLGDSHLHGVGIRPQAAFSRQLRQILDERTPPGSGPARVLDLTIPGANTYINMLNFRTYFSEFKPHVVILNYNHNDVYGRQSGDIPRDASAQLSHEAIGIVEDPQAAAVPFTKSLKTILYKSALLGYVSIKLNNELKLAGFAIPGTEFHHLLAQSHDEGFGAWSVSRGHLHHMIDSSKEHGARFIAYLMPQLAMLENYEAYDYLDKMIEEFFLDSGSEFVQGVEPFLPADGQSYSISRYDGHPSERAHIMMAQQMCDYLLDTGTP
jgi:hypothetical protein